VPTERSVPDHVLRFWRALDLLFDRVAPTRWGAVVTDRRFPAIWDVNYARIDEPTSDLTLSEIEGSLLPAIRSSGARMEHLVSFRPDVTEPLFGELEGRGHRITWDLVMDLIEAPPDDDHGRVEDLAPGPELWHTVTESLALFGVDDGYARRQMTAIERELLTTAGKRWFGVREPDGTIVSLGAVMVLDGVGYIDNIATIERARGRGHASAVTSRAIRAAERAGAVHVCLFADPDDAAVVRLYERLGFGPVGRLVASRGPLPAAIKEPREAAPGSGRT
jgi:ribosomal protein S18 acetylase RimI-like enzyme